MVGAGDAGSRFRVATVGKGTEPMEVFGAGFGVRDAWERLRDSSLRVQHAPLNDQDALESLEDAPARVGNAAERVHDAPLRVEDALERVDHSTMRLQNPPARVGNATMRDQDCSFRDQASPMNVEREMTGRKECMNVRFDPKVSHGIKVSCVISP
uniref:Uncharacterized protein n=1 Tax=Candidatus Kentrum sp. LPFa TaxID=2126335 RepID=A0A450WZA7_9GAMM|nr:MAG: hypothetical protein BECKLPF1236B_GA0070989_13071 [Candidatus Kentron sp. LPFa]